MTRQPRLLAILQLFEQGQPTLTVEDMAAALGMPTSTIYRHVRSLVQGGLLDPVTGAAYALGPGFIRYDRILRQNDELVRIADPVMWDLLASTRRSATVVLSRRFKDCVMCVHDVASERQHAGTSYERGVAMPLFLGATSKVILANLPDRTLKSVYLANEKAIKNALHVNDWNGFKAQFRDIRRAGYALTDSEVAPGRVGLAAPISRAGQVVAGLSLVIVPTEDERSRVDQFIPQVISAAEKISRGLTDRTPLVSR
jgi:DNA-binding IclR family transcriptional regulator